MEEAFRRLTEALQRRSFVIFAYLFGSKVKGYSNDRSDWDIAVYFSDSVKKPPWARFDLEAELSRAIGGEVQVIVLNEPLSPVLGFEILKHGILFLDRDKGLRINFENNILRHYHDWQHFLRRQMAAEKCLS